MWSRQNCTRDQQIVVDCQSKITDGWRDAEEHFEASQNLIRGFSQVVASSGVGPGQKVLDESNADVVTNFVQLFVHFLVTLVI